MLSCLRAKETDLGWWRCPAACRAAVGCTSGARSWRSPCSQLPCPPAVDHVVPEPESSLVEAFEKWREWADGKACCDYALHVDIPRWSERVRQELHAMVQEKGLLPFSPCCWLGAGILVEGAGGGCAVLAPLAVERLLGSCVALSRSQHPANKLPGAANQSRHPPACSLFLPGVSPSRSELFS